MTDRISILALLDDQEWVLRVRTTARLTGRDPALQAIDMIDWKIHAVVGANDAKAFLDGINTVLRKGS